MPRKPPAISTVNSIEPTDGNSIPVQTTSDKRIEKRLSALDKHNVTDERLAKVLDDGLNAGKVVEETVNGMIVERVEPDHAVRQKYLDMGMRAREWGTPEKLSVNIDNRRTVVLSAEDRVALEGIVLKMKELNSVLDMGDVQDGEIVTPSIAGHLGGDTHEEKG